MNDEMTLADLDIVKGEEFKIKIGDNDWITLEVFDEDMKKAKEKGLNAHSIVSDKGLVSLATYKPSTLEEWLSLPGLGKQSYLNFASDYLKAKDG